MFVGIVGAGISGLYCALLLLREGHQVAIFEASGRIGGRIYTHYFSPPSRNNTLFFEAGAMRIPRTPQHQQVFDLVDFLNAPDEHGVATPDDQRIELRPFVNAHPNNFAYVHGRKTERDDRDSAARLGLPREFHGRTAQELLDEVLAPWLARLRDDFDAGFAACMRHDELSFRAYLRRAAGWPHAVIEWVEVLTSQTNGFDLSFTEIVVEHLHYSPNASATVRGGMARLTALASSRVGAQRIFLNAPVHRIVELPSGRVELCTAGDAGRCVAVDRAVLAVPAPAVANMLERPRWGFMKEQSIRGLHFAPLYKMGLLFRSRFWEQGARPSFGGQSVTDLRFRWIVYPSEGVGADGPGVLQLYAWMTDASRLMALPRDERARLVLHDLSRFFSCSQHDEGNGRLHQFSETTNQSSPLPGEGSETFGQRYRINGSKIANNTGNSLHKRGGKETCGCVNVYRLFVDAFDVAWSSESASGGASYLPGQFSRYYAVAKQSEGNIYFAGEHLSRHHTWITGSLESALSAVRDMLARPDLEGLKATTAAT